MFINSTVAGLLCELLVSEDSMAVLWTTVCIRGDYVAYNTRNGPSDRTLGKENPPQRWQYLTMQNSLRIFFFFLRKPSGLTELTRDPQIQGLRFDKALASLGRLFFDVVT